MTDHRDYTPANDRFRAVTDRLLDTYSPIGVCAWLMSPNRQLDSRRPVDLMDGDNNAWNDLWAVVMRLDGDNW